MAAARPPQSYPASATCLRPRASAKSMTILADRGLFCHAWRGGVAESSGPVAAQIWDQHAVAGLGERRRDLVVGVSVVGKTVQQDDRETLRVAAFFVCNIESWCLNRSSGGLGLCHGRDACRCGCLKERSTVHVSVFPSVARKNCQDRAG